MDVSLAKARLYIRLTDVVSQPTGGPVVSDELEQKKVNNCLPLVHHRRSWPYWMLLSNITIDAFSPVLQDKSPTPMEVEPGRSSH